MPNPASESKEEERRVGLLKWYNMKKTILTCSIALMAFPLFAQYTSPGFYRIQNQGEAGRYISIQNDKVSEESKNISLSSGKAANEAVEALQLVKSKDSDPGTIIYISGDKSSLILEAQGLNTSKLLSDFGHGDQSLQLSSQGELKTEYSGYQIDLIDYCYDYPIKKDGFCGVATLQYIRQLDTDQKKYALWRIKKINNDSEFFGINPDVSIQVGQNEYKYYTTLFTSFAYQLSDGMTAYYIDQHIFDTNHVKEPIAELKEIPDGRIPAATPVIIKCSSANVEDNKVTLLDETLSPISGNELKGRVFCFIPTEYEDQNMKNALEFNQNTMRVIGFVDGELALVNDANSTYSNSLALKNNQNKKYLPANKVYLPISSSDAAATANGIKLLLPNEYAVAASISTVMSEDYADKEGVYTLTGIKIKDTNSTENLPNGIYIVGGKKHLVK